MLRNKSAQGGLTIGPVAVSTGAVEFTDIEGLRAMFGIKRSLAYQLLHDGVIAGVSLRRTGRVRGKRLFDVASVREFLRGNIETKHSPECAGTK